MLINPSTHIKLLGFHCCQQKQDICSLAGTFFFLSEKRSVFPKFVPTEKWMAKYTQHTFTDTNPSSRSGFTSIDTQKRSQQTKSRFS
jgi:hypothetical protein